MKDPIALIRADTGEAVAWACGECGLYCGVDEEYAKYHCGGRPCDVCGKPSEKHFTKCAECRGKTRAERRQKAREEAKKVSPDDYDGPVYWEENDAYYSDIDLAWDAICDEFYETVDLAKDQTLWACDKIHLTLVADDILDAALEAQEHHEDARDYVSAKAIEELRAFCSAWNDAHGTAVESWYYNNTLIVIPDEWQEEFIQSVMKEQDG